MYTHNNVYVICLVVIHELAAAYIWGYLLIESDMCECI